MNKRIYKKLICFITIMVLNAIASFPAYKGRDVEIDNDVKIESFTIKDKTKTKSGLYKENGVTYLYGDNEELLRNYLYKAHNKYYYSDKDGKIVTDIYLSVSYRTPSNVRKEFLIPTIFYFNENGEGRKVVGKTKEKLENEFNIYKYYDFDDRHKAKVGDFIEVGNLDDVKLYWEVLEIASDRMLIVSQYVIDAGKLLNNDKDGKPVSWENSNIRKILNNRFISIVFENYKFYNNILETSVVTGDTVTRDKIFLLSDSEIEKYFGPNDEDAYGIVSNWNAMAIPSALCIDNGLPLEEENIIYNGLGSYMTRTIDVINDTVKIVKPSGELASSSLNGIYGIRPAMWVKIENE